MARKCILRLGMYLLGVLVAAMPPALSDDIVGKVKDEHGQPIVGARIDISTAGPKQGQGIFCPSCYLDCRKSAKTDAEGAFTLSNRCYALRMRMECSPFSTCPPTNRTLFSRREKWPRQD